MFEAAMDTASEPGCTSGTEYLSMMSSTRTTHMYHLGLFSNNKRTQFLKQNFCDTITLIDNRCVIKGAGSGGDGVGEGCPSTVKKQHHKHTYMLKFKKNEKGK